ncbi:MAG: membrane dipeptidase [Clostridia bacterium]|nr:membrane dipeptidase [Clostridia bacterium]
MYKIFDLHNDYFLKLNSDSKKDRYIKNLDNNIISAIWTSGLCERESFAEIERARDYVNRHEHLFLGVEDLHFLSRVNLDRFLSLKPIYAGLTWNTTNCIAGGAHESGRLTNFGKKTVKKLEENNIKIDTAHLNEDSFMDLSKITANPLFCSHTAFYGLQPNARNLKDYQLKMIIDSGGIIGLCLVSDFINGTKKCTTNDVVAHIDYFACKFGVNNIAIGTDFYGTNHLPRAISNYKKLTSRLSLALEKLGYTEKSINKIFYENAYSFFFTKNCL